MNISETPTQDEFLGHVKDHAITILRDDGCYRHVRFSRPSTNNRRFDLITWPGFLCYAGDMGEYVFARTEDMFAFFRHDGELRPNFSYWGEKVQAADVRHGVTEYSPAIAKLRIAECLDEAEASEEVRHEVDSGIIVHMEYDDERELRRLVYNFKHEGFEFHDFCEVDLHETTYHYKWCCFAIAWGIRQYDEEKRRRAASQVDE